MSKSALAAVPVALMFLLSACGGDGGGGSRPSADEIAKSLTSDNSVFGTDQLGDLAGEGIDCVAKALADSDLSNEALRAIVDQDKDFKGDDEDTEALKDASTAMMKCVTDLAP